MFLIFAQPEPDTLLPTGLLYKLVNMFYFVSCCLCLSHVLHDISNVATYIRIKTQDIKAWT